MFSRLLLLSTMGINWSRALTWISTAQCSECIYSTLSFIYPQKWELMYVCAITNYMWCDDNYSTIYMVYIGLWTNWASIYTHIYTILTFVYSIHIISVLCITDKIPRFPFIIFLHNDRRSRSHLLGVCSVPITLCCFHVTICTKLCQSTTFLSSLTECHADNAGPAL